ncbi:hypothetical protein [Streptomyces exfoliatus]|uniref:hypothetical protein n=1 Tax=Streptomyces exfoliatus TaxID=1905 RepID=UPI003C2EF77F
MNRTGIPWEDLPNDFLPRTVAPLNRSTAVVWGQSVKTAANVAVASQGIDAGKKIKGRKRHLITDPLPGARRHPHGCLGARLSLRETTA